jgi:drug/metabolite transporter (DMT)-like permease
MARHWSLIAVVASAACFGTLAVLTPLAYEAGAGPLPLLTWRFVFAAVLLGSLASIRNRRALAVPPADFLRYAVLALTGYGAASICFFYALTFVDASVVAVLLYTYPAFVTIAGWMLLGHRADWGQGAAVLVTFAGCALVVGLFGEEVGRVAWQGVALGLGAAVGYTLFNLLSARWLPGRSRLTMMAYTFGIAAVLPGAGAVLKGGMAGLSTAGWQPRAWWLLAAIVLIPTFAAVVLYLEGIRGLGPAQAAVISTFEPLFTIALAAMVWPDQRLTPLQMVGAGLVLGGVVIAELRSRLVPPRASV